MSAFIKSMISDVIRMNVTESLGEHGYISDSQHLRKVLQPFERVFLKKGNISGSRELNSYNAETLTSLLIEKAMEFYEAKEAVGLFEGTDTPDARA